MTCSEQNIQYVWLASGAKRGYCFNSFRIELWASSSVTPPEPPVFTICHSAHKGSLLAASRSKGKGGDVADAGKTKRSGKWIGLVNSGDRQRP